MAQQAERAEAVSSCTVPPVSADACNAAVLALVRVAASLPPAEADALLAAFVIEVATSAPPGAQLIVGGAIEVAAGAMTDPDRAATAIEIAQIVSSGETPDEAFTQTLASPN